MNKFTLYSLLGAVSISTFAHSITIKHDKEKSIFCDPDVTFTPEEQTFFNDIVSRNNGNIEQELTRLDTINPTTRTKEDEQILDTLRTYWENMSIQFGITNNTDEHNYHVAHVMTIQRRWDPLKNIELIKKELPRIRPEYGSVQAFIDFNSNPRCVIFRSNVERLYSLYLYYKEKQSTKAQRKTAQLKTILRRFMAFNDPMPVVSPAKQPLTQIRMFGVFITKRNMHKHLFHVSGNRNKVLALIKAAATNRYHLLKQLLALKSPINKKTSAGMTALHYAAQHNNTKAVQLLLRHNAHTHIKNNQRLYAYHLTTNKKIKRMLVRAMRKNNQ